MNNKTLTKFSIIIGFAYVIFILWLRLIHERLPKEIGGNHNTTILCFYIVLLLVSLILFIYYLRQLLHIKSKYKFLSKILEINLIQTCSTFFIDYILHAPFNFYIWVYNKVKVEVYIAKIGALIWNRDPHNDPQKVAIILCVLKLLISVFFIIDIVIFHKFNYFYKSLILLLLILITTCFMFILKDVSQTYSKFITNDILSIEHDPETCGFIADFQPNYTGEQNDTRLFHFYQNWIAFNANCMFVDKFYEYYHLYNKYTNLIYYGIFVIGWSYILFVNF